MRYLKSDLKLLAIIILGLSLMALAGDPVKSINVSSNSNNIVNSN